MADFTGRLTPLLLFHFQQESYAQIYGHVAPPNGNNFDDVIAKKKVIAFWRKILSLTTENFKAIGPVFEEKIDFLKMKTETNNNNNKILKRLLCPLRVQLWACELNYKYIFSLMDHVIAMSVNSMTLIGRILGIW